MNPLHKVMLKEFALGLSVPLSDLAWTAWQYVDGESSWEDLMNAAATTAIVTLGWRRIGITPADIEIAGPVTAALIAAAEAVWQARDRPLDEFHAVTDRLKGAAFAHHQKAFANSAAW